MPYIEIKTNVKADDTKKAAIAGMLGKEIEIIPGKTEKWLMTSVEDNVYMTFAGSDDACVIASVSLLGSASPAAYEKMTASLCEKLGAALGIAADRVYVKYSEYSVWGWNGGNF